MKTQIFSGRRPRVKVRETSFRMRRVPQKPSAARDSVWAIFHTIRRRCPVLPQSRTLQCPRFVTNPALGDQTRIGFCFDAGQCVMGEPNYIYPRRPSPPALARFPTVGHSYGSSLCCHSVAILIFSGIPLCLSVVHLVVSGFRCCSCVRNGLALHSSSIPIVLCLFVGWVRTGSPGVSWRNFSGV
jgi:hypothetical protein